ncbi:MAG: arylesterase [Burkholderiales bacterium]|nr:arylesterase [Burkholderiales bacterium]MDR4517911.1 arylesterase [Nitrosomonas sp.]
MTRQRILFIFIAFLILSACSDKQPGLPVLSTNAVILAYGDSLTAGNGAPPAQNYPSLLAEKLQRTVINAGVPGEISENGLKRLPTLLDKHQPTLLLLCHGGNDMIRKLGKNELEKNLRAMIDEAISREISVVLIGVPKPGIFLESLDIYDQIAAEYNLPIEREIVPKVLADNALKSDLIHPNARGYALMADSIYLLLQKNGAI